jgi:hypothetical protein
MDSSNIKMKFDPKLPFTTRSGLPARILCTDLKGERPIAVAYMLQKDKENVYQVRDDGYYYKDVESQMDLVNIPQRRAHADLIIAWAEGAKIQVYDKWDKSWQNIGNPSWDPDHHYRIAE